MRRIQVREDGPPRLDAGADGLHRVIIALVRCVITPNDDFESPSLVRLAGTIHSPDRESEELKCQPEREDNEAETDHRTCGIGVGKDKQGR